jgi:class 3 adenylate cyclase
MGFSTGRSFLTTVRVAMTLYLDIHHNVTATPEEIEEGHLSDLEAQEKHGVKYLKYWFDPTARRVCCLVDAPSKEACNDVHSEAHGMVADDIIEVEGNMVEAFLGGPSTNLGAALSVDGSLDGGFRTVLFTDIVGSTTMTQELGDEAAMGLLGVHDEIVRRELSARNGREIKHTGDGIMASFVSPSKAVECAVAVQEALKDHNEAAPRPVEVRIGMSAGEPVGQAKDLFGTAVQLANRVCQTASAGEILVANVVCELCRGKPISFADRGKMEFKGFADPVRIHAVDWA